MSFIEEHAKELNERQAEAVVCTQGPVLVLAGAGSGKTRVLTYRIAHLVCDYEVPLDRILAMTFSNKAALEMHERVKKLLHRQEGTRFPWISTFHSVCARLLRVHGKLLGYQQDFAIYDESDQVQVIKDAIANLNYSTSELDPDAVHSRIGDWKNEGKFPEDVSDTRISTFENRCAEVYKLYADKMLRAQAMDFDDLLLNAYRLFRDHESVRSFYQNQWQYVLVDEFQDTNELQYRWLKLLLNENKNICVVGDDDQSIYGWRGAKVENILDFDKEFPNAAVIKLEQNYRSTGTILKAASAIISKNEMRHEKTLWTKAGAGQRIQVLTLADDRAEAQFVVGEINRLLSSNIPAEEIAVFYRVNSLSRGFEEECLRQRIPYRIVGGFRFYERKEVKDILAYLKFFLNPSDVVAFRRALNSPARGVGKASLEKIEAAAVAPIGDWLSEAPAVPITGKAKNGLAQFVDLLCWGRESLNSGESLSDLVFDLIRKSGYVQALEEQGTEEAQDRKENIQELLSAIQEFEETYEGDASHLRQKLRDFLERVSLMADVDQLIDETHQVTFMSLHAAKGLEFRVCFMAGMEEGLFPTARSFDSYERTEEERRLCYVGITRAREKLYLTKAARRRTYGSINFNMPSRFIKDLPPDVLDVVRDDSEDSYGTSWGRPAVSYAFKRQAAPRPAMDDFDFDQRTDFGESAFRKGDRVQHPSFGEGIVQKVESLSGEECLSIVFSRRGLKKVLSRFVKKR